MAAKESKKAIDRLLRDEATNPLRMEKFLDAWNRITDSDKDVSSLMLSSDFEHDIENAIISLERNESWVLNAAALSAKLAGFPNPSLVVQNDGTIVSINNAAFERLSVEPGCSINDLPIRLVSGREITEEVQLALKNGRNRHGLTFLQAVNVEDERSLMLTILRHEAPNDPKKLGLVIVVDPIWSAEFRRLYVEAYGLTEAEAEVLLGFLNGQTTKQIAQARGRSHMTVKTQLQSVLSKSGTSSQAELMRLSLGLGQFGRDITEVAELASHPHRRHFEIPTEAGRKIEFFLSGDSAGAPVLFVPDITMVTLTAPVEAALHKAGLCVASVLRPGCGLTDIAAGVLMEDAIARDLLAVARQLAWDNPAVLLHSSSCHYAPAVARQLGHRISRILLFAVPTPPPYLEEFSGAAPWLTSMARARNATPALFRLIVTSGIMGWRALGTRRFASIQLRGNRQDVAELKKAEALHEMDRAMRLYFSQAPGEICADARRIFSAWNHEWPEHPPDVRLLQGTAEPTATITSVRALVRESSEFMSLTEVEGAGFMLPYTHTADFVSWLSNNVA